MENKRAVKLSHDEHFANINKAFTECIFYYKDSQITNCVVYTFDLSVPIIYQNIQKFAHLTALIFSAQVRVISKFHFFFVPSKSRYVIKNSDKVIQTT